MQREKLVMGAIFFVALTLLATPVFSAGMFDWLFGSKAPTYTIITQAKAGDGNVVFSCAAGQAVQDFNKGVYHCVPVGGGAGDVNALVVQVHVDGNKVFWKQIIDSDAGRGTVLLTAFSTALNGDSFYLSPATFDVGISAVDLTCGSLVGDSANRCNVSIHGAGKYATIIKFNGLHGIIAGNNTETSDLSIISYASGSYSFPWGSQVTDLNNAILRNVYIRGGTDGIYIIPLSYIAPQAQRRLFFNNIQVIGSTIEVQWDAIQFYGGAGLLTFDSLATMNIYNSTFKTTCDSSMYPEHGSILNHAATINFYSGAIDSNNSIAGDCLDLSGDTYAQTNYTSAVDFNIDKTYFNMANLNQIGSGLFGSGSIGALAYWSGTHSLNYIGGSLVNGAQLMLANTQWFELGKVNGIAPKLVSGNLEDELGLQTSADDYIAVYSITDDSFRYAADSMVSTRDGNVKINCLTLGDNQKFCAKPSGASQSPWLNDINGNGFSLVGAQDVNAMNGTFLESNDSCVGLESESCFDYFFDEGSCNNYAGCSWNVGEEWCQGTLSCSNQNESQCNQLQGDFDLCAWTAVKTGTVNTSTVNADTGNIGAVVSNTTYGATVTAGTLINGKTSTGSAMSFSYDTCSIASYNTSGGEGGGQSLCYTPYGSTPKGAGAKMILGWGLSPDAHPASFDLGQYVNIGRYKRDIFFTTDKSGSSGFQINAWIHNNGMLEAVYDMNVDRNATVGSNLRVNGNLSMGTKIGLDYNMGLTNKSGTSCYATYTKGILTDTNCGTW